MGILGRIFGKKIEVDRESLAIIMVDLDNSLKNFREKFINDIISFLEEQKIVGSVQQLSEISMIEAIVSSFQLVNVVGFAFKYIPSVEDSQFFSKSFTKMTYDNLILEEYFNKSRERYLDCQGDLRCLVDAFSEDFTIALGVQKDDPKVKRYICDCAALFSITSQVMTARAFGDKAKEKELMYILNDVTK